MDYTIKPKVLEIAMRHVIDSAVHNAVSRYSDQLGDAEGLTHRIARAAAESAIEQFTAYANAELRLIQIDHEMRAREWLTKPPSLVLPA